MSLACSACKCPLPTRAGAGLEECICPGCQKQIWLEAFPALFRPQAVGEAARPVAGEGEASCFFHAEKRATVACESCGRFLCALCDLDFNGSHYCPQCLRAGQKKEMFERYRRSWGGTALFCATVPVLMWPVTLLSAPAALFIAIWGWNKSPSLTGRKRRWVFITAMILSLLQIGGWVAAFFGIFYGKSGG